MLNLNNITLICVDCVDVNRAIKAIDICKSYATFADIKLLTSINTDYEYKVSIEKIKSVQDYSTFMIRELYKHVYTSHALCIQWDGYILCKEAWTNDYLQYDYIGAPWVYTDSRNVGNGGFSLRSKDFLLRSAVSPNRNTHPEDLVSCRIMNKYFTDKGIKFAPEELAHKFSHEGNQKYGHKWNNSFGWHDSEVTNLCNFKGLLTEETKRDQLRYWGNRYESN